MSHKHHERMAKTFEERIIKFQTKKLEARTHLEKRYYRDVIREHKNVKRHHKVQAHKKRKQRTLVYTTATIIALILFLTLFNVAIGFTGFAGLDIFNSKDSVNIPQLIKSEQLTQTEIIQLIELDSTKSINNLKMELKTQNKETNSIQAYGEFTFTAEEDAAYFAQLKEEEERFRASFQSFEIQAFSQCNSFSCDSGNLDRTISPECNVTTKHEILLDGCTINGTSNLIIRSAGTIVAKDAGNWNSARIGFKINITGNLTLETNSSISVRGEDKTSASLSDAGKRSQSGGNLLIAANQILNNGTISARAGDVTNLNKFFKAGVGGTAKIIANNFVNLNNINAEGGDVEEGLVGSEFDNYNSGGNGGTIFIKSNLTNKATISVQGGYGGIFCKYTSQSRRGNGGIINISGDSINLGGSMIALQGERGGDDNLNVCSPKAFPDGNIYVKYSTSLNQTSNDFKPLFWIKPDSHNCNIFDGTKDLCSSSGECIIGQFRCSLEGSHNFNNLTINGGFIDVHDKSATINISGEFIGRGNNFSFVTAENYNIHHSGSGTLNFTAKEFFINGSLLDVSNYLALTNLNILGGGELILNSTDKFDITSNLSIWGNLKIMIENIFINSKNIFVYSGGKILSEDQGNFESQRIGFNLNSTLINVFLNGEISTEGNSIKSNSANNQHAQKGGNLNIFSHSLILAGTINSKGSNGNSTATYQWHYGGDGGNIRIFSDLINISGLLQSTGGDFRGGNTNGGNGGTIRINSSTLNILSSGIITATGGIGRLTRCQELDGQYGGRRGDGGIVNITSNSVLLNGSIFARRGQEGFCNDGSDGDIFIFASSSLNKNGKNTFPPFWLPNRTCDFAGVTSCIEEGQCLIEDISCEMSGFKNFNNLTLTNTLLHIVNKSLSLNISDSFTISLNQYETPFGFAPTYKLGSGTLNITSKNFFLENILYNPFLIEFSKGFDFGGSESGVRFATNNSVFRGSNLTIIDFVNFSIDGSAYFPSAAPRVTIESKNFLRIEPLGIIDLMGQAPLFGSSLLKTGQSSGQMYLNSSLIDIQGTIFGKGVNPVCNSFLEFNNQKGGKGGKVRTNSNSLIISGSINLEGGGVCDSIPTLLQDGGNGGTILVKTNSINLSGDISLNGGSGSNLFCSVSSGNQGAGGLVNISGTNLTISGTIRSRRGSKGVCSASPEGTIYLEYFNWLKRLNPVISPIFWLKPDSHQCNLFNKTTNSCLEDTTCVIDNYRCQMQDSKNYNHLIINAGFVDTHNQNLFLNISGDLNLSPVDEGYINIEDFELHHSGSGKLIINATNINLNKNASIYNFDEINANQFNIWGNLISGKNSAKINSLNLNIFSGGNITSKANSESDLDYILNINNTLNIFSDASISSTGDTGQTGGILRIFSDILNNFGKIAAIGGFGNFTFQNAKEGGEIRINARIFNSTGNLSVQGGSAFSGGSNKGSGGSLHINASNIFSNGNINAMEGSIGFCDDCANGSILIEYVDSLNITNSIFAPETNLIKQNAANGTIYFPRGIDNTQIFELQPINHLRNNYSINIPKNPGLNRYAELKVPDIPSVLLSIVVLQNGSECLPPECDILEYNRFAPIPFAWFNVTHWTTYSIQGGGKLVIDAPTPFRLFDENITIVADFNDLGQPIEDANILLNITDPDGFQVLFEQQMSFNSTRPDLDSPTPSTGAYEYIFPVTKLGIYNYSIYANKTNFVPRTKFGFFHVGYINTTLIKSHNVTNNPFKVLNLSGLVQWDNSSVIKNASLQVIINNSFIRANLTTNNSGEFNYSYSPVLQGQYPIRIQDVNLPLNSSDEFIIRVDYITPGITFNPSTFANNTHLNQDFIEITVDVFEAHEQNITFRFYNTSGLYSLNFSNTNNTRTLRWPNLNQNEQYWFNVTIFDFANNHNSTETWTNTLDNIFPELEYTNKTRPDDWYDNRDYIYLEVEGQDLYEWNMTFRLYNQFGILFNDVLGPGNRSINWTGLDSNRIYWYNVTITDRAGNVNTTETRQITLDSTFPEIVFTVGTLPSGLLLDNKNWIFVNVTAGDLNEANISFELFNGSDLYERVVFHNKTRNYTFIVHPDDVYFYNITIEDWARNKNTTETRDIDLDDFAPVINITFPANLTAYTSSILNRTLNWTLYEQHLDFCWYRVVNNTINDNARVDVPCERFTDNISVVRGWNNVTFWANDTLGHNSTYFHEFLMNTKPTIPVLKAPPNNTYKIYNNLTFDVFPSFDEDGDPLKYNYVVSTDKNFQNVVLNDTNEWDETKYKIKTLPDGDLYWMAAAVDHVEQSNYSEPWLVDNVQSRIRITEPANLTILDAGLDTGVSYLFEVFEANRSDWIIDTDLSIIDDMQNFTYQMIPQTLSGDIQLWKYTYTVPKWLTPRIISATAKSNNGAGELINYTHIYRVTNVNAPFPTVDYLCNFPTYSPINHTAEMNITFSLGTLIENMTIEIIWNDNSTQKLALFNPLTNNMTFNRTYYFNTSQDYVMNISILDINNHTTNFQKQFYSRELLNLNLSSDGNMTFRDLCTNNIMREGNPIVTNISQGVYNVVAYTTAESNTLRPWLNITHATIWNESKYFLNHTSLTALFAPPKDRLVVKMFSLQTISVNFSSAVMYLNYSDFIFQIGNETLLELWKCDTWNCSTWTLYNSSIDISGDVVSTIINQSAINPYLPNASTTFGLLQKKQIELNESEKDAPTPTGGGGVTRRKPKPEDLIVPKRAQMTLELVAPVSLFVNSSVATLVKLINTGELNFSELFFRALSSEGLSARITPPTTKLKLDTGEEYFFGLGIESLGIVGQQEVTIEVKALDPAYTQTLTFFLDVQELEKKEDEDEAIQVINLTEATFAANPQCLELKELIDIAKEELEAKNYESAIKYANDAINACKDLSATLEQPFVEEPLVIRTETRTGYVLVGVGAFLASFVLIYFLASIQIHRRHDRHFEKQISNKI